MTLKVVNFLLMLTVCVLLAIQPSTSSPLENDKLVELTNRLDRLQTKVESLEAEKGKLTTKIAELEAENSEQDDDILHMKSHISNLESLLQPKSASYYTTNQSIYMNDRPTQRATTPPSSCEELTGYANFAGMDGVQLVQNKVTKKIEAVFCHFSRKPVSQNLIGHVDVKTKSVHFYVQRNTNFYTVNAVIPFDVSLVNEGNAFNLALGIFTVPVPGIYHFDFSAVKFPTAPGLGIVLQVNDSIIGWAYTYKFATGTEDVVSLSASLRLAAGDRVSLYNRGDGVLYDISSHHFTHFTGWLVEEDLM